MHCERIVVGNFTREKAKVMNNGGFWVVQNEHCVSFG